MKKLILLLSIIFISLSCSSDSDSNETNPDFIGKWTIEFEKDYTSTGVLYQTYNYSLEECYQMSTYEFKTNGNFVKDSYDFDAFNCIRNPVRTYPYSISGNNITIYADESDVYIITENTSNDLKLKKVNPDNSYTIIEYSRVN
jgi:hypothetical protein